VAAGTLAQFDVPANPPPLTVTMNGGLPMQVVGGARHRTTVPVVVTNSSGSKFGGVVTVNLFVSADQTLDGGDTAFAQAGKKLKLANGQSKTVKVKVASFPGGVPDGDYTVIADVVDKFQKHSTGVAADPVHIAAPFSDLVLTIDTPPGATLSPGGRATASVVVTAANANVPAKGSATIHLFASPDQSAGNDQALADPVVSMKLKPQASKRFNLKFQIPAGLASGSYFLVATLQPGTGLPTDPDLTNNMAVASVPFTII
jgi:hypothetical protein